MAKLPTLRKLFKGDFKPEEQELIETMSPTVNNGLEVIYEALNGKLSFSDNILCTVKDLTVELDSNGIPKSPTSFNITSPNRLEGCWVEKAENLTNSSTYPTGAPFITYSQNGQKITINHITGLVSNNVYRIRVIANG